MLESIELRNFTVFEEAKLEFSPRLNMIVGDNGSGKTHLLKLAYALLAVGWHGRVESKEHKPANPYLISALTRKLLGVFRPGRLGRLVHQGHQSQMQACELKLRFAGGQAERFDLDLQFDQSAGANLQVTQMPTAWIKPSAVPIFVPARELLSIYPSFVSLYDSTEVPFPETWHDICLLLGRGLAKDSDSVRQLLGSVEQFLGGKISLDQTEGRFYRHVQDIRTEIPLIGEGHRKLGMIYQLIANGSLRTGSCLFWDEPEANLNPRLIKKVAALIVNLSRAGVQIFLASHSLFLLRELVLLLDQDPTLKAKYFGLHLENLRATIQAGASADDIGRIAALEEEISQTDAILESGHGG